jgi:hypothetical protein
VRRFLVLPLLIVAVSCSDPAGANGKFCDVVKRIKVSADPLSGAEAYNDPKVLGDGMAVRMKAYSDLAATAPSSIKADAAVVSDGINKISIALSAAGNKSAAANDPTIAALVRDKKFLEASLNVQRFSETACKEK